MHDGFVFDFDQVAPPTARRKSTGSNGRIIDMNSVDTWTVVAVTAAFLFFAAALAFADMSGGRKRR